MRRVSTVTADRTGKIVLLTYSLTASHCSTEAHLAGVPFPRSFDSRLALRQSCSVRLKSLVGCGCKKTHRFRVLIKAFLVKKKGTKTAGWFWVGCRFCRFWAGWPSLDLWWHCCTDEPSDHNIVIAHLKGWGMKQTNHFNLGIESRWCLNHHGPGRSLGHTGPHRWRKKST